MSDKDPENTGSEADCSVINALETEASLSSPSIGKEVKEVIHKISEFSSFLNSIDQPILLNVDYGESQELLSLLLALKKDIKTIEGWLSKSTTEIVDMKPISTNQEYLDEDGSLESVHMKPSTSTNQEYLDEDGLLDNEHTDSGIDYEEDLQEEEEEPLGSNTFRFNFKPCYDIAVESVLYPESFKSLTKFDTCNYICIQKVNHHRAICLLCFCDILTRSTTKRICKKPCLDHVLGQRHTKACMDELAVAALKNYHETFWNFELPYQAHQVYFAPKNSSAFQCHMCDVAVQSKNVVEHIKGAKHRSNIFDLYSRKEYSEYFLFDLHLNMYGISFDKPKVERSAKGTPEKKPKNGAGKSTATTDVPKVDHVIKRSYPYPTTNTAQDFIANRFKEHLKCFKERMMYFGCNVCKLNFKKEIVAVKQHILLSKHQKLAKIDEPKYKYFCELCFVHFENEIAWDKHFSGDQNSHAKVPKIRLNKAAEYECVTCKVVFYGDDISITRHKSKSGSKKEKSSEPILMEKVKTLFKSAEVIEKEAEELVKVANDTTICLQKTLDCVSRVEAVLSISLVECKAHPFGSRISGLGNEKSDLDLFIDTGDMYYGNRNQDSLSQGRIVKQVESILCKQKSEFTKIRTVPGARTPIVKAHHIQTGLDCDLSFRHGLSVENTNFVKLCLDLQPITQHLILILKKWSEINKLPEHITTYALAMLVIFFLQVNGHLLSVKDLQRLNPSPAPVINGWNTIKYTASVEEMKRHVVQYNGSLIQLLKGFFKYYATFNYFDDTVCPLLGHTIKRKLFKDPRQLPPEMSSYVRQLRGDDPEEFRYLSPFCIQDPFDLSHNLTKACQSATLSVFKRYCSLSFDYLATLK